MQEAGDVVQGDSGHDPLGNSQERNAPVVVATSPVYFVLIQVHNVGISSLVGPIPLSKTAPSGHLCCDCFATMFEYFFCGAPCGPGAFPGFN